MKNIKAKLQTFAGAMMVPIILFVLVGFYVSIGSALSNYAFKNGFLHVLFSLFAQLGFMFMNNLEIWFAIGIAFTLAKKRKGLGCICWDCFLFRLYDDCEKLCRISRMDGRDCPSAGLAAKRIH